MKLSIIIPIYNQENNIVRLLDILVPQLSDDTELILVDDGSTDSSLSVCKKYELSKSVIVINKPNGGVSSARNTGLKSAQGEYIAFIDSDDLVAENYIGVLLSLCEKEVDLIQMNYFYNAKKSYKKTDFVKYTGSASINDIFDLLINNNINAVWNKVFRNSIIKENHIAFLEDITIGEDQLFVIDFIMASDKYYFCEDAVYYYYLYNYECHQSNYQHYSN